MTPIYLDHAATSPLRDEVRAAMEPFASERFGNATSSHAWGRQARAALEDARERIAIAIGARRQEIVFVRGGTEADNLAIVGSSLALMSQKSSEPATNPHVVTVRTEHKAVLAPAQALARWGGRCTVLSVDSSGQLDEADLDSALVDAATLLSVMWVNNETGVIHDIDALAHRARDRGVLFHTDAVQALGKLPVRVDATPIDLLSLSGHKLEGPKSAAALFVRKGVALDPLLFGGGQEDGLRPGTPDVAGAVGLAEAVSLAVQEREETAEHLTRLRDRFEHALLAQMSGARIHGSTARRAPHISSVAIRSVEIDTLLALLDLEGVAVSTGSACASGSRRASHVLLALYDGREPPTTLRFSFGRTTTADAVDRAVGTLVRVVDQLRSTGAGVAGAAVASGEVVS